MCVQSNGLMHPADLTRALFSPLAIMDGVVCGSGADVPRNPRLAVAELRPMGGVGSEPQAAFMPYADSAPRLGLRALEPRRRAWAPLFGKLHTELDRAFGKASLESWLPQRDLHHRSIAKSFLGPFKQEHA